jgi:hypothetical protein
MLPADVDPNELLSRLNGHPDDPLLGPTAEIGAGADAGDGEGKQSLTVDAEGELQEAVATDGGDD